MSRAKLIMSRIMAMFSGRAQVGMDKAGNRYFTRSEEIEGALKEKRWVIFKGEEDPTTIPVEWICWLNGQRKKAPTPEELAELEARRELVKQNIELMKKKEEEERKSRQSKIIRKSETSDLRSFMQQFPDASLDKNKPEETRESEDTKDKESSSEPKGSGASYQPGTWQPPT
ncbi:hypothetical protein LUZ60_017388 [Juncus effusus]|nr:hypothetical protein LUZ60_017388 [Juncus effusus]